LAWLYYVIIEALEKFLFELNMEKVVRKKMKKKKKKRPKSFNAALSSDTTEHGDLKLALW